MKTATTLAAAALSLSALPAAAAPLCDDLGFAGLLASCNRGEPIEIRLAAGQPLYDGEQPVQLQSGAYYELVITSDGDQELALRGPGFFRAIWMNEVVINEIEVRPMALDSFEFDDAGTATLSFVAIQPGTHTLQIPGSTGETQRVEFSIQ